MSQEFWESISDIDPMKRKPSEWAQIYNVRLFGDVPNELWSEYEWSYNFDKLKYMLLPDRDRSGKIIDSNEKSEKMEMRALEIKRDLFKNADMGEKMVLQEKYIEINWVKRKLNLSI